MERTVDSPVSENLYLSSLTIKRTLKSLKGWSSFVAIVGFITCALLVLAGFLLIAVSTISPMAEIEALTDLYPIGLMGVGYAIFAFILFFPNLFLYNSSKAISKALKNESIAELNEMFENLRAYFKFIGIVFIAIISIQIIAVVLSFAMGFMSALQTI